ncbi:MAG: hypothetical protein ACXWCR_12300 [Flavitalea sp.]
MIKYFIAVILLLNMTVVTGQEIRNELFEDSVLGWIKVYNFKGVKESKKVDNKVYSAAQLSLSDSFANWIQASYVPKGGLGDVIKSVSVKIGPYNQYAISHPQSYGAYAKTYRFLKYNASGKMIPATNHHSYWAINANEVPGWPIRDLSTPTAYYFTMPAVDSSSVRGKLHDMTNIPNLKPYITFNVEHIEGGSIMDYVLLCRDNKSPFIKVTKGEYLNVLESALPRYYETEKNKIHQQNKGNQRSIDYLMKTLDEKNERFTICLKKNQEKYKSRLNELAYTSFQPDVYDLESNGDVFSSGSLTDPESLSGRVPVYRIDPEMNALCKKDKPQWILISWSWAPQDLVEKHMHESIINNFNFDYIYNFFFAPDKVKGQTFQPLRSPLFKETIHVAEASAATKANKKDKSIHFFDDFSTNMVGKKPIGWNARLILNGSTSIIAQPDGLEGNWALLHGHLIIAAGLKPLPQNFSLSYDLVASQNFAWGAKGLTLRLSKQSTPEKVESFLSLKLRPGFDGRDGEAELETKFPFPPGYSNGTKWLKANGFSNNKKNNRITVTIKKQEEVLQVYIDNHKIVEFEKAIPAAHVFNALSFDSGGNSAATDIYYISNIKITKL